MTFREWVVDHCSQNGMLKEQAEAVADAAEESITAMRGQWNRQVSSQPKSVLEALAINIDLVAVAWIERNTPMAWFKVMFDGTAKDLFGGKQ